MPEPVVQTSALFTAFCNKKVPLQHPTRQPVRAQRIVTPLKSGAREQLPHGQEPKGMSGDQDCHSFPKCQWENYFFCDSISPLSRGNDKNTSPQNEEGLLVVCSDVPGLKMHHLVPVILPHSQAIGKAHRLVCVLTQARSGPGDSLGRGFQWL